MVLESCCLNILHQLQNFFKKKIEEVLINYEPRVNLTSVNVDDDQDRNRLVVDISFQVIGVPGPHK